MALPETAGEEIVIAKAGRPVARLVPIRASAVSRTPGLMKGRIRVGKDFDAPVPGALLDAFEGKTGSR